MLKRHNQDNNGCRTVSGLQTAGCSTCGFITAGRHQLKGVISCCCAGHGVCFAEQQVVYLGRVPSQCSSMQGGGPIQQGCHGTTASHLGFSLHHPESLGACNLSLLARGVCSYCMVTFCSWVRHKHKRLHIHETQSTDQAASATILICYAWLLHYACCYHAARTAGTKTRQLSGLDMTAALAHTTTGVTSAWYLLQVDYRQV